MEGSAVLTRAVGVRPSGHAPVLPFVQRYWAYISYSHADSKSAEWLHEALERFRVPPEVVGRRTRHFIVPSRLRPIFRDRSELAASSDLGGDIREAIECSRHLVVLCSPAAAASRWVNEEIRTFRRLRPDGEVLAVIVAGEPNSADAAAECLPPALREQPESDGLADEPGEPIAADLRPGGDGRDKGLLKLVAGLLDVRLDELARRHDKRRHRRWMLVSLGSVAGMALTSGLAVVAVQARDEAREQRRQAESLVGFMIGDLKDKLEPVGRLDALDAVGGKVLAYYQKQDKGGLSDEALAQRSKALTLMGDIAQRRGDFDGALRRYQEGEASTAEALRRDPGNPQRLFDHAQNVYWIGNLAAARGRYAEAGRRMLDYRALAQRMIAAEPGNPKWQLEGIYADSNLGVLAQQTYHYRESAARFAHTLGPLAALRRAAPRQPEYAQLEVESLGYLADGLERSGQLTAALAQRGRQLALLQQLLAVTPDDGELLAKQVVALRALAREQAAIGQRDPAIATLLRTIALADRLVAREPRNQSWRERAGGGRLDLAALLLRSGQAATAGPLVAQGCAVMTSPAAMQGLAGKRLVRQCFENRARLSLATGATAAAMLTAGQLLGEVQNNSTGDPIEDRFAQAGAQSLIGDIASAMGDRASAVAAWTQALDRWPMEVEQRPGDLARRKQLLERLGRTGEAAGLGRELASLGWRG